MSGLVAAYLMFCPLSAPTQCSQHDYGVEIARRWCGTKLGPVYYRPKGIAGTGKIVCK